MKRELKPATQYGDLKGKVICDGFNCPFLVELWRELNMPSDFFPIAISFDVIERDEDEPFYGQLKIRIYACDIKEYGGSIDDIQRVANERDELIVKKFEIGKENLAKILKKIKRLSLLAINKHLGDVKIYVSEE